MCFKGPLSNYISEGVCDEKAVSLNSPIFTAEITSLVVDHIVDSGNPGYSMMATIKNTGNTLLFDGKWEAYTFNPGNSTYEIIRSGGGGKIPVGDSVTIELSTAASNFPSGDYNFTFYFYLWDDTLIDSMTTAYTIP